MVGLPSNRRECIESAVVADGRLACGSHDAGIADCGICSEADPAEIDQGACETLEE